MRTALLGKILAAQSGLAVTIERLMQDGDYSSAAQCREQLMTLVALQRSVGSARWSELGSLQQFAGAAIATAQSVAQLSRTSSSGASAQLQALTVQSAAEVRAVADELFTQRIFDPYLRFTSPDDERTYRRREAENKRYVDEQLATGTPTGTLNATGATIDQMLDAHEHGAGGSPDFQDRWNRVTNTARRHRHAMHAEGHSTKEYDQRIDTAVRRYLRSRGLSEAEVEARLAVSDEPLNAVKPFIKSESDATELVRESTLAAKLRPSRQVAEFVSVDRSVSPSGTEAPSLQDVMAKLRSAGLTGSEAELEQPSHGLALSKASPVGTSPARP